ncbi:hypothetical protein [Mucilaginibacter jinjuensis]|uniref:SPW repeat-containing protein n=1 Tax=Mucilaginibacter jinjuensis TaxID=1176721 RepID=A0ABY7TD25_9SPHI|nr:hypothetical protein [Mucilaginibacter jinjuensis]WCT13527.1 hypothetical protein PQO05_06205 [Mucilaginibacter jinjuensis]
MTTNTKTSLDNMTGGLFLMSIFTAGWIGLAEYNLKGRDYGVIGVVFLAIILVFISHYFKFNSAAKTLQGNYPATKSVEEKQQDKWFMIIGSLEGLAIFLTANVLINTGYFNYFVPAMALIVGLHFFPLAYIYKRSFDYFMGAWTCLVAFAGMLLTQHQLPVFIVIAIVGVGCAIATTLQGTRMVVQGKKAIRETLIVS